MKRFLVFFAAGLFLIALAVHAAVPDTPRPVITVTVEEGDTLWDIASRHSDDTIDVRKYMYEIRQANHLGRSSVLQPGQVLKLPAPHGDD